MAKKQPISDLTPRLQYLMGFVAGSDLQCTGTTEVLLESDKRDSLGQRETQVFKTREAAEKAARKAGYKWTRGYVYWTSNPKNAKGMKLLSEVTEDISKREVSHV